MSSEKQWGVYRLQSWSKNNCHLKFKVFQGQLNCLKCQPVPKITTKVIIDG